MFKMSRKSKGINAERDLIHKFWGAGGWSAVRIAGSGSMRYPSADILATNKVRRLAIECKTSKDASIYLPKEAAGQLRAFSAAFGAEPWLAVKFKSQEWFFIGLEDLAETERSFFVDGALMVKKGILFEELINE